MFSCGSVPDEETAVADTTKPVVAADSPVTAAPEREIAPVGDTATQTAFVTPPPVKRPTGIYQAVLPYGDAKILHTVAFYPNTFRLQEEYLNKADSVVLAEGTWAPSQGYIWLYKEQLVRGRYVWQGDTLQYYSPRLNQKFSLTKLTPASANPAWQSKKQEGALFYGVGTEPFWSVEVSGADSIVLNMPDWTAPLRVKFLDAANDGRNRVYSAPADSLQVTVMPYFCNDGMSDFVYPNRVLISHKGKTYKGCGTVF